MENFDMKEFVEWLRNVEKENQEMMKYSGNKMVEIGCISLVENTLSYLASHGITTKE